MILNNEKNYQSVRYYANIWNSTSGYSIIILSTRVNKTQIWKSYSGISLNFSHAPLCPRMCRIVLSWKFCRLRNKLAKSNRRRESRRLCGCSRVIVFEFRFHHFHSSVCLQHTHTHTQTHRTHANRKSRQKFSLPIKWQEKKCCLPLGAEISDARKIRKSDETPWKV